VTPSDAGATESYVTHLVEEHAAAEGSEVDFFERTPEDASEPRSHETRQVFVVLEGELVLHTDASSITLTANDSVSLDAGERYEAENPGTDRCVGIRFAAPTL
jgi:mannose-6-phosphate isomerase-like protein (cupin superfamily)